MRAFRTHSRTQDGFTLIELLAVMAIIAILAAIVAPAVSGTKDTGANAQSSQDALQVRTAATDYFSDQETVEVVTTNSITSLAVGLASTDGQPFTGSNATSTSITATQKTSSRWPEKFITSSSTSTDSIYYAEVPVSGGGNLRSVYFVDKVPTDPNDVGKTIGGVEFLQNFTAINIDTLVTNTYLEAEPQSIGATRQLDSSVTVHTFIWLFKKTNTPGTTDGAGRDVRVFRLTEANKVSVPNGTLPALTKFDLTYERVF